LVKQVLSRVALAMLSRESRHAPLIFKHAICVSTATRNSLVAAGIPVANARVIRTGVDTKRYLGHRPDLLLRQDQSLNLLYAGRLVSEKGVDVAIKALEKLVIGLNLRHIRLGIAGSDSADYERFLRQLVTQLGLDEHVSFFGHVPGEEMPQLLRKFDVLLVPSTWQEPFSRMVLEGMSAGLVVVATPLGGTTEILSDGENGLLFAPGNSEDLTQKIVSLASNPGLRRRLALAGKQTVDERFTVTKMMDELEGYIQDVACAASHAEVR
jgi:glycosyltransferase involved in cell wall biosynthesis